MKRALRIGSVLILLVFLLPFAGPYVGLASFQHAAHEPGRDVVIPNGRVNVYQSGEGQDAVLIHGQPGSASMMQPLGDELVGLGFRVTRYDRLGWGHSGQRSKTAVANPTAHAEDMLQLIAELSLKDPVVVGYSYGGGVAMEANRLAPEVVRDLVLVSSAGNPLEPRSKPSWLSRAMLAPLMMRWVFGLDWTANAIKSTIFAPLAWPERLDPGAAQTLLASLALPDVPDNWARERNERFVEFSAYQPELVKACTLMLHGEDDQMVSPEVAANTQAHLPDVRVQWITGAGHGMVLTRAAYLAELISQHHAGCLETGTDLNF